jgi:hypothetical protein
MMAWVIIAFTLLLVVGLSYAFFLSARTIIRDMNRRMAEFEARLERDANAVLDDLLDAD